MKKTIAVCLTILLMAGMLAACGQDDGKTNNEGFDSSSVSMSESQSPGDPLPEEIDPDSEDGFYNQAAYQPGVWEGSIYTNKQLGLTVEVDEEWQIFTSEEMTEMNVQAFKSMNYTEAQIEQALNQQIYDTMFANTTTGSNVQITVENLPRNASVTEDDYLDITKNSLLQNSSYEYEFGDYYTLELGGQDFRTFDLYADGSIVHGSIAQRMCVYHMDGAIAAIIITDMSGTEEGLNALTDMLQPL